MMHDAADRTERAFLGPRRPALIGKGRGMASMNGAAPGHHRLDPRVAAYPRLSGSRPSDGDLDPLGLEKREPIRSWTPRLRLYRGRSRPPDLHRQLLGRDRAASREIIAILRATYCGTIGVEFMHIQDPDQKAWIQERIENAEDRTELSPE